MHSCAAGHTTYDKYFEKKAARATSKKFRRVTSVKAAQTIIMLLATTLDRRDVIGLQPIKTRAEGD